MKRRQVLKLGCAALATAGVTGRLYAAPTNGPRFLLVFLRGGYDSVNLLVPYSSSFYYESRPTIAIARPEAASSTGALALTADWARLPHELLAKMSNRIINEVDGINRVAYDITSKPPGTIEWE